MKRVAFYTLGCKLNFSETSTIARSFKDKGYKQVDFTDEPDIFIINTCSVTDNADKKCRKVVREARSISPNAYVAIIGCYAQLKPKEISSIEGVDAVLGAAEKFRLHELIDDFVRPETAQVFASEVQDANEFITGYSYQDRTRTFLKLQDGCNYNCSFCTIPLARGKSRSGTLEEAVTQAKEIAQRGIREIVLTGINLGDVGIVNGRRVYRFIDLIKELDEIEGIDRYRISSIEPNLLTDEIIEFVACSKRFAPHFHIPLQSGSDELLERMLRRYRTELYTSRIERIKELMPDACIGVDVIVGFPGETEAHFTETYTYLVDLPVDYLHVFTYSERVNTPAAGMYDAVPKSVRAERSKQLRNLSAKKKRAFYESKKGYVGQVLFEKVEKQGSTMQGYTENYLRVEAPYDPLMVNELKPMQMRRINEQELYEAEEVLAVPA